LGNSLTVCLKVNAGGKVSNQGIGLRRTQSQIPAKYCLRGKGKKVIVLTLDNGEYQRSEYLPGETIACKTFPDRTLSVDQVLAADAEDVI
jgi:Uma2 family endonuclease